MDEAILITELNDFIFCPISIYFHKLYGNMDKMMYQSKDQINGTNAHEKIDNREYTTRVAILQGIDVYCEKYDLIGKIDTYDIEHGILRERKKRIRKIYDGYIFQVYAQYFSLIEMGYDVKKIEIYSIDDNKKYDIELPKNNIIMFQEFEKIVAEIKRFDIKNYVQTNREKCKHCIYEPACYRSLLEE